MSLYSVAYRARLFLSRVRGLMKNSRYDHDITSYTDTFKRQYGALLSSPEKAGPDSPVVLLYSSLPLSYTMHIESIMGRIMETLGFKVVVLTSKHSKTLTESIYRKLYGLENIIYIQDFWKYSVSPLAAELIKNLESMENVNEIKSIKYKNTNVGLHALASYNSSIPAGNLKGNRKFMAEISELVRRSCQYVEAVGKVIESVGPVKVLGCDKGDVGMCEIFYESIHRGIDYLQWCSCHEPESLMIKRYNVNNYRAHPFSISDKTWNWIQKDDRDYSESVLDFFKAGYLNGEWFEYKRLVTSKMILDRKGLVKKFNLSPEKKIAVIFSHILDDANFFYGKDLFEGGFSEWLTKTVQAAAGNREVNWMLKLHPANIYRREVAGTTGEYREVLAIKNALGDMPDNITVIPPDTDINPYSFFSTIDYAVTVRGTVGAELPCFGIPVLTAGTGRYSRKGFTVDSETTGEYLGRIADIQKIAPLSDRERGLAVKHAHLFFKGRPAKYDTAIRDIYPYAYGHPLNRDIEILGQDILKNRQLLNIARFISFSKDEDYLIYNEY